MNDIEKKYVYDVYNQISDEFNITRQYPWPVVKDFINNLETYSFVCDVGSGNGKNLFRKDLIYTAVDLSEQMCKLSQKRTPEVIQSNILSLPFKNNSFDVVISIACIHHLNSIDRRSEAIKECLRILKSDGKLMISVWANSEKYGSGDQFIKWNNHETKRFYHLYSKDEIYKLAKQYNLKITYDKYNYYLIK